MAEWVEFTLYAVKEFVSCLFGLDLDLGFSLGDFIVACAVLGIVASALIVKSAHIGQRVDFKLGGSDEKNTFDR